MKIDILAFGAHPDDIELGCGGSISLAIAQGKKVGLVDLTRGELGTRGTSEIRKKEAKNAASILKTSFRINLGFRDGFFVNDEEHQKRIISVISQYQPDIVLCNSIRDRHIDHGKGSKLVSDACFLSGLSKIETVDALQNKQEHWRPKQMYHYIQWEEITPDFVVDISSHIEVKIKAVLAYESQFYTASDDGPKTPINSKNFTDSVRYRARNLGRLTGVEAGEGFTTERYPCISSFDNLK